MPSARLPFSRRGSGALVAAAVALLVSVPAPTPALAAPGVAGQAVAASPAYTSASTALSSSAVTGPDWVVRGAGYGHGVGMSQHGAREMARDGLSARQILGRYYTGTTYDAVRDDTTLHVNLRSGVSSTTLTASARGATLAVPGQAVRMTAPVAAVVTFARNGGGVRATCGSCTPTSITSPTYLEADWPQAAGNTVTLAGIRYEFGDVLVWPTTGAATLEAVIRVRLHDQYLDYVREMPWSWPGAALQAQAAAARGYALSQPYKNDDPASEPSCMCHVYDDSRSQVFAGYPPAGEVPYWPAWKAAVRATGSPQTGFVARYAGSIISAFYSSSSGGRTQHNEEVWGGTPIPYLRSVADPWSLRAGNPHSSWRTTVTGGPLATAFRLTDVARLDLRDRTAGNGVDTATATSAAGVRATIDGEVLRARLGLKSTAIRHLGARIGGLTRYEVAANVARRVAVTSTTAVLASGESAAVFDASVAGPLSATLGGPLLLTAAATLPAPTMAELDRRRPSLTRIVVVGGPGSVNDGVLAAIRERYPTVAVERIGGSTRYAVAANVAGEIRERRLVGAVVVASGIAIADALGASGPASALRQPILLTRPGALPSETSVALSSSGATTARIAGGTASVSPTVEQQLKNRGLTVIRLGGADRYAVAANVATHFRSAVGVPNEIILTSGSDDALADSLAAGSLRMLMVLTTPVAVPEVSLRVLQTTPQLETVTVVGGPASVPTSLLVRAQTS